MASILKKRETDLLNNSWVRQFIDMDGLKVVTDLLATINKAKNRQVMINRVYYNYPIDYL
jgi:hypothetical protein